MQILSLDGKWTQKVAHENVCMLEEVVQWLNTRRGWSVLEDGWRRGRIVAWSGVSAAAMNSHDLFGGHMLSLDYN